MSINERIKFLVETYANGKPSHFAEAICVAPTVIASYLPGGRESKPSFEVLEKIISKYPQLRLEWLIKGEEPITQLIDENQPTPTMQIVRDGSMPRVVTVDSEDKDNVLFVPIAARAGYLAGYGDPEHIEHVKAYTLPNFENGTYRMFQVEGQSMYPTLKHGDIVVAEWVEGIDRIKDERVHVIVSRKEGIIVKRAINAVNKLGVVVAKSDNTNKGEHPNIELRPNEIDEIWYARGFFSYSFPAPADTYIRLTNVEIELEAMKKAFQKFLNQ